jgi:hypothetical protein
MFIAFKDRDTMEIKTYSDASVRWIMQPPAKPGQHGEVSSGVPTKVVIAAWRELDCEAVVKEVNPRGSNQTEIIANAELDAIFMAATELGGDVLFTDCRIACDLAKKSSLLDVRTLPRKWLHMKIADFLTKKSCGGRGYIVLNSPSPVRNWIDFIED